MPRVRERLPPVPVFVDGRTSLHGEGKRFHHFCGLIHVRTLARRIAIFYMFIACFELFYSFYYGPRFLLMGTALLFMLSGLILYGDHIEKSGPYLPFVVLNGLGIIVSLVGGFMLLIFVWQMPASLFEWTEVIDLGIGKLIVTYDLRPRYWRMSIAMIVASPIMAILWQKVYAAYSYMKYVIEPLKRREARKQRDLQQMFWPMRHMGHPIAPPPPYVEVVPSQHI